MSRARALCAFASPLPLAPCRLSRRALSAHAPPPPPRARRRPPPLPSLARGKAAHSPRAQYGEGAAGAPLQDADGEPLLHVVFVAPQIHWNSGNIGRTCLGLGARLHLVGPLGFSLDDRHVRRAGLDYWHHVDLRVYDDWAAFSSKGGPMHAIGGTRYFFTKFGAEPAANLDYASSFSAATPSPTVLVFGSEVDGFTCIEPWLNGPEGRDERRVAFPMVDTRFRSYNLSTTASMSLWDAYKALTHATAGNIAKTNAAHADATAPAAQQ